MKSSLVKNLLFFLFWIALSPSVGSACSVIGSSLCAVSCQGRISEITSDLVQKASNNEKVCALGLAKDGNAVTALLSRGVDINTRTTTAFKGEPSGNTALFTVISKNRLDLFSILLQSGIDVNTQDKQGLSPLMYAVWDNRREMVEGLLKNGALPNLKDHFGKAALCLAKEQVLFFRDEEIISMLESRGATCEE